MPFPDAFLQRLSPMPFFDTAHRVGSQPTSLGIAGEWQWGGNHAVGSIVLSYVVGLTGI